MGKTKEEKLVKKIRIKIFNEILRKTIESFFRSQTEEYYVKIKNRKKISQKNKGGEKRILRHKYERAY